MSNINYELVYKCSSLNIDTLANRKAGYRAKADRMAEEEHVDVINSLILAIGHPNFEITNIACMAKGISHHVYARPDGAEMNVADKGSGKHVCVFCGCDDFDGY